MDELNQGIEIFSGDFNLTGNYESINLNGSISFQWVPTKKVMFEGTIKNRPPEKIISKISVLVALEDEFILKINGLTFGTCIITNFTLAKEDNLQGEMISRVVLGEKSIPVSKIRFAIPNLREFNGEPVKYVREGGTIYVMMSRMIFENEKYLITIA